MDGICEKCCVEERRKRMKQEKLECAVNNVIQNWIDKHGLNINAFLVEDVEQVKV